MTRLNSVETYVEQKEKIIKDIHKIFEQTPEKEERSRRIEAFNTLLLLATWAEPKILNDEIKRCFAENQNNNTIALISEELREINRFCVSDANINNKNYQNPKTSISFFPPASTENEILGKALSDMIFRNTKDSPEERISFGPEP
ncbi:hypothetical protein ACNVED_01170 [Legionella sp. D16C41]|uniref:hypothetical protein n=1 Tax=Legionella sp. D16C41 TaxID=3402688 RepID=UPI003AF78292